MVADDTGGVWPETPLHVCLECDPNPKTRCDQMTQLNVAHTLLFVARTVAPRCPCLWPLPISEVKNHRDTSNASFGKRTLEPDVCLRWLLYYTSEKDAGGSYDFLVHLRPPACSGYVSQLTFN